MEYIDEKIAEQMNAYKKGVSGNIYDGLYIREEYVPFSEYNFFDDTFSIMLPDIFTDMKSEIIALKYPSVNRPQILKTSEDSTITIGLSKTDVKVTEGELSKTIKMIKQNVRNFQPANVFFDKKCVKNNDISYGWFDFKSYAMDGQVYYMNAYPIINEKMYHVVFSCMFRDMDIWKPIILEVLNSMKDLTKKNK